MYQVKKVRDSFGGGRMDLIVFGFAVSRVLGIVVIINFSSE